MRWSSIVGMAGVLFVSHLALADREIPRLHRVTIDGQFDDWGQEGYRIDVLGDAGAPRTPKADQRCRLAWDEQGLLVWIRVVDTTPTEAESVESLWEADCIELFVYDEARKSGLQSLIAAGRSEKQKELRHREGELGTGLKEKNIELARKIFPDGYAIEARVPWKNFDGKFVEGTSLGVQIIISDYHEAGRSISVWFPSRETSRDGKQSHTVRLSDISDEPEKIGVSFSIDRWRVLSANIRLADDIKIKDDQKIELIDQDGELGATHALTGDERTFTMRMPMPYYLDDQVTARLQVEGREIVKYCRTNLNRQRMDEIERQRFASSFAFTGEKFPTIDFLQPNLVEDLLGPYTLSTTYYDRDFNEVTRAAKTGRYGAVLTVNLSNGKTIRRNFTLFRLANESVWDELKIAPTASVPESFGVESIDSGWTSDAMSQALRSWNSQSDGLAIALAGAAETKDPVKNFRDTPAMKNDEWWLALDRKKWTYQNYDYVEVLPKGIESPDKKWPLILFLHGSGERGNDVSILKNQAIYKYVSAHPDEIPAILIAPQCPRGIWWTPVRVMELLKTIQAKYKIDPDRIYLTGLSMGAFGSFSTGMYSPDTFAAVAPLCGGGEPRFAFELKDKPMWVFHGDKDFIVRMTRSTQMVDAIKQAGGNVKYTIYPGLGHDIWTKTYSDPAFYEWLLAQKKGESKTTRPTSEDK